MAIVIDPFNNQVYGTSSAPIVFQNQYAFHARRSTHLQPNGFGNIVFDSVVVNSGNRYNNTNGRFTAEVAGLYYFAANGMAPNGSGSDTQLILLVNGNQWNISNPAIFTSGSAPLFAGGSVYLNAGDYVNCQFYGTGSNYFYGDGSIWNGFCGFLIG